MVFVEKDQDGCENMGGQGWDSRNLFLKEALSFDMIRTS
jgi:hypothetical protein